MISSPWQGKKVAFLGDSITDQIHVGTSKNYWQYLQEEMGIDISVYGINGATWIGIPEQVNALLAEQGTDVDALFIFMGTNNYMGSTTLGVWYSTQTAVVNANGVECIRQHRTLNLDQQTLCGQINSAMQMIKEQFPLQQIILMTPIHRAYAAFSETNVQPDENYANGLGLFLEQYIEKIRQAADIWSCPLIDLYRCSGLHPLTASHSQFFHDAATDLLHPNAAGHLRIARTMMAQMLALPPTFRV